MVFGTDNATIPSEFNYVELLLVLLEDNNGRPRIFLTRSRVSSADLSAST